MREELPDLASDLKEQILYMRELGIDSLDADFDLSDLETKATAAENTAIQRKPSELSPAIEKFIPDSPIGRPPESRIGPQSKELLQSVSRISRLPSFANRPQGPNGESKPSIPKSLKRAEPKKEEAAAETMLIDITQKLPDVNETVAQIQAEIGDCRRCELCNGRTNIAHSTGNPNAELMFIGEAPGADEDEQGKPFVGKAGQLLTKIIEAIGISREDVFIGNINRCRPPGNRQPTPIESAACKPYLLREIAAVKPKVIVVLGNTACQNLLETKTGITKLRGNFQDYFGVKVMPTFHPAYLLRDPHKKREVWEDMKKVREYLKNPS